MKVVEGDARAADLPSDTFDLVHARLILVNVPRPEEIVREMVRIARPGGIVASHEADFQLHVCDPPSEAWDRLSDIYHAYARGRGVDLFIARRVHRMFREAGLTDVRTHPLVHLYPPEHSRRTIFWDFLNNVREGLLTQKLVSEPELDELMQALHAHIADPHTLMISHLFVQTWGRKP